MDFESFLNRIIDAGLAAARKDYADKPDKLSGAVAGFEACRWKNSAELLGLLATARKEQSAAHLRHADDYWHYACYAAEVEWVCNCVSAALVNVGIDPITPVTARGMMKAAEVLGVR